MEDEDGRTGEGTLDLEVGEAPLVNFSAIPTSCTFRGRIF